MSTIKDIARAAGVSVSTVSHVVNKTKFVSEELTERVNKALLLCDTLPNFVQKKSSTTKDEIIVILLMPPHATKVGGRKNSPCREHSVLVLIQTRTSTSQNT